MEPDLFSDAVPFLRPWSAEAAAAEPFLEPYVSVFRKGGKSVLYIAGEHVCGVENATIRTLERAFREFAPQGVVVEGFHTDGRGSDGHILHAALRCARPPWDQCSERDYAVFLAHRAGVPFVGGEPSDAEIFESLKDAGFAAEDMLGYYLVRQVPGWRRAGIRDAASFDPLAARFLKDQGAKIVGPGFRFDLAGFGRWFERRNATGRPLLEMTDWDAGPADRPGSEFFNAICRVADLPRERSVLRRIAVMLDLHDRVLILYGSGHLVKSRKALEAVLGPSSDVKHF